MASVYKSAMGRQIDIDNLRLKNEHIIAVGNMRVNAGGDLLGPGGKVVKTRAQLMQEYYSLNTPVAADIPMPQPAVAEVKIPPPQAAEPIVISENSGLDEGDFGEPEVAPVVSAPPVVITRSAPIAVTQPEPVVITTAGPTEVTEVLVASPQVKEPAPAVTPKFGAPVADNPTPAVQTQPNIRGSLASAVAKSTVVTQTAKLPMNKANGVQRF